MRRMRFAGPVSRRHIRQVAGSGQAADPPVIRADPGCPVQPHRLDYHECRVYDGPITAGWSSLVARRAHNPKVAGSNPAPAIKALPRVAPGGAFFTRGTKLVLGRGADETGASTFRGSSVARAGGC